MEIADKIPDEIEELSDIHCGPGGACDMCGCPGLERTAFPTCTMWENEEGRREQIAALRAIIKELRSNA